MFKAIAKRSFLVGLFFVVALFAQMSTAQALIVGGAVTGGSAFQNGGVFQQLTGPIGSVGNNNFQSNNLFGFNELQGVTLSSNLAANQTITPLLAGTQISSHYIFFDPAVNRRIIGYIDFDANVMAIMTSNNRLLNSDFLGDPSANYINTSARGLENVDTVTFNALNPNRIYIDFTASSPGDYIRIITRPTPTPEPATMALFGAGLAGLGVLRRRQFKA